MNKWNMIVDVKKCVGCYNCFLSCKDEHIGNEYPGYAKPQPAHSHTWIDIELVERGQIPMLDMTYVPKMCNHCDEAPCMKNAEGAITKRDDGIVIFDPVKSKGRKDLVSSCPYGAIYWNEEEQVPQTWYFDAHLLDQGWKEPRCTQVCPTGALKAMKVSDEEMQKIVAAEELTGIEPKANTKPRVHYKNLKFVRTMFVAGTLIRDQDGIKDAAENVTVSLYRGAEKVAGMSTDNYGDFKLDGLTDTGAYQLRFEAEGSEGQSMDIALEKSLYVGTLVVA